MKLKKIEFTFENCESVRIDGKYIGDFNIGNINTTIRRVALNSISRLKIANSFYIEINKAANVEHCPFGIEESKYKIFDRFDYKDITSISFDLEKDDKIDHYEYYLNWTGESNYTNAAQSNYISKAGNLYIVVEDGKSIKDYWDIDQIDDSDAVDLYFNMIGEMQL